MIADAEKSITRVHPQARDKVINRRRRRDQVAEFILRGQCHQGVIADKLGVSRATITRDIQFLEAQWHKEAIRNYDAYKARKLRELDRVKNEAWEAWEESKKKYHKIVSKAKGADEKGREITTTVEERTGDPAFLKLVVDTIDKQAEMAGLKVHKIAPVDPSGEMAYHEHMMESIQRMVEDVGDGSLVVDASYVAHIADAAAQDEAEGDGTEAIQDDEAGRGELGGESA